jgi:hypothetical protein
MSTVLDRVTEVQDQVLAVISSTKEPVSNVVATVVGFVVERAPQVPALPFADQLPTPKELIDNQAKFASKLVSTNKSVALGVAKAAQPLTDQLLDRRPAVRSAKAAA